MNRNKYLYTILLFLLLLPVGHAFAAPATYTRAQVDSIVAAEVSRQLAAEQIDLKIERSANERYAMALSEQDNRLTEHDHEMSTRYTWMSIIFTVLVALTAFFVPYIVNKRYEERLKEIADNNENKINNSVNEKTAELNAKSDKLNEQTRDLKEKTANLDQKTVDLDTKLDERMRELNQKIAEMDDKIKAHDEKLNKASEEIKENVKKAEASELISQAHTEENLYKRIDLYNEAIRKSPENIRAYNNVAYVYNLTGKYKEAKECCDIAIKLNPYYPYPYRHRGTAYRLLGKFDEAIEDCSTAIDFKPNYANAFHERGLAYQGKANQEKDENKKAEYTQLAEADFKKAEELGYKPEE